MSEQTPPVDLKSEAEELMAIFSCMTGREIALMFEGFKRTNERGESGTVPEIYRHDSQISVRHKHGSRNYSHNRKSLSPVLKKLSRKVRISPYSLMMRPWPTCRPCSCLTG